MAGLHLPPVESRWRAAALRRLTELAVGRVSLTQNEPLTTGRGGAAAKDRYGRDAMPVVSATGIDIAGALIAEGLGWFSPSSVADARTLRDLERDARRQRRGLWSDGTVPVLHAANADAAVGRLAVVWGRCAGSSTPAKGSFSTSAMTGAGIFPF